MFLGPVLFDVRPMLSFLSSGPQPSLARQHALFAARLLPQLLAAQRRLGITAHDLAKQANLSPQLVYNVLHHRLDSYETLITLAGALHVPV